MILIFAIIRQHYIAVLRLKMGSRPSVYIIQNANELDSVDCGISLGSPVAANVASYSDEEFIYFTLPHFLLTQQ